MIAIETSLLVSIMDTHLVPVPSEAQWFSLFPANADIWVYQQQARKLFLWSGTGIATYRSEVVVSTQPVEFHVGNQVFFQDSLRLTGEELDNELAAIQDPDKTPPFILTSGVQWIEDRIELPIPADFDGCVVFLRTVGEETLLTQQVEATIVRVKN